MPLWVPSVELIYMSPGDEQRSKGGAAAQICQKGVQQPKKIRLRRAFFFSCKKVLNLFRIFTPVDQRGAVRGHGCIGSAIQPTCITQQKQQVAAKAHVAVRRRLVSPRECRRFK